MIKKSSFSKKWIISRRKIYKRNDPSIIEKAIRALSLVEKLKLSEMSYVFKGGTSLLLLLKEFNRFSIDVDIIFNGKPEDLEKFLPKIIDGECFTHYEKDIRKNNNNIPKSHFKFFYNSTINNRENYILLDVLFEKENYPEKVVVPIEHNLLDTEGRTVEVVVPSIDSILGDKLTAFAPNTTGISYGVGKEAEIIKQLFDVGTLFDHCENISMVRTSFHVTAQKEIGYRGNRNSFEDVLNDAFDTSLIIPYRGAIDSEKFRELQRGITSFSSYAFNNRFNLDQAINKASKAAYLSQLVLSDINDFERYNPSINLEKIFIENPKYSKLNRIKKTDPEAFFYFKKAIELLEEKEATHGRRKT